MVNSRRLFSGVGCVIGALCLPSFADASASQDPASSLTAPPKTFKLRQGASPALEETYRRAGDLLKSGRVREAAEQFAVVAKLAPEPLRSHAILKFGYASSILDKPGARGALTSAAQSQVGGSEGREIRSFAGKLLSQSELRDLLTAPARGFPGGRSKKTTPAAAKPLWTEIDEIETLRQKGRLSVAISRYRELSNRYADHPVVLNNLALVLAEIEDRESEAVVRRAFKSPGAEEYIDFLYDTLGVALLKQGRAAESIENFRRALAMRETAERDLHMAQAMDAIGQPDAADRFRARARALDVTGQLAFAP